MQVAFLQSQPPFVGRRLALLEVLVDSPNRRLELIALRQNLAILGCPVRQWSWLAIAPFAIGWLAGSYAQAKVRLPDVFGDHMVLQRERPISIWGLADAGEAITVSLDGETVHATAERSGHWRVSLKPRLANSLPSTLVVEASNRITCNDILVGDVWMCSGQSNMHWPLRSAAGGGAAAAAANLPQLRLLNLRGAAYPSGRKFTESERSKCSPSKYLHGSWQACTPNEAADFSAVAFFFGTEIHTTQGVPIGLIHNAIGGTPTEAWISRESLAADDQLRPLLDGWFENEMVHSFCRQRALVNLLGAEPQSSEAARGMRHPYMPGFMYEAGIEPLAPFALRGVLWYQGESNAHNPPLHTQLFTKLISHWRHAWHDAELPFLFVQLPNLEGSNATLWPELRESQRSALRLPQTAMAVTIDLGNPADVHPIEKREVGHRLALLARHMVYGESIECSGPKLEAITIKGAEMQLRFGHVAGGLATKNDQPLTGFEVAGADGVFLPAQARLENAQVMLRSPVAQPEWVRFGFSPNPVCHLVNQAGLVASPFIEPVK